ncbi:MAG TPA: hypothetical protein VGO89_08230 [Streptomyces sp.]|jgi:hypothetical protein|nr:hypothetical protein [Streptomyces sp.]
MSKLRLDLEEIRVDSFATGGERGKGTVLGHDASLRCGTTDQCTENSCGQGTCYPSCDILCGSYKCGGDSYPVCGTGGTSCNVPCEYTCDGALSCNAANTCLATCYGQNSCPLNC